MVHWIYTHYGLGSQIRISYGDASDFVCSPEWWLMKICDAAVVVDAKLSSSY
jgi:hypothetical protein